MESTQEVITNLFLSLSESERKALLAELHNSSETDENSLIRLIRDQLFTDNVQTCAHCDSLNFIGWGTDKGIKRFKCKDCGRTFTEFSGTWISHIHHKDKLDRYLRLLLTENSIAKIAKKLAISIQTSFDWRHKVLSSLGSIDQGIFTGVTESDETFFLHSEKGSRDLERSPRKRGGSASQKGISNEQVAVIVTADRSQELDLSVATLGRITKADIEKAIGERILPDTILCTDSHASYKGFAIDKQLKHYPIKANTKEYVRDKVYHIQHVNSMDSRLKNWINIHFRSVSTKYLQNYLNWFRIKEILKDSTKRLYEFIIKSILDKNAWRQFKVIGVNHEKWLVTHAILE